MKAEHSPGILSRARQILCVVLLVAMATMPSAVHAAVVLDQSNVASVPSSGSLIFGGQDAAQTFTVGISGLLTRVDVQIQNFLGLASLPLLLDIRSTSGGVPVEPNAPVLASASLPAAAIPSATSFVSFSFTPFAVNAGDVLAIALRSTPGDTGAYGWMIDSAGGYGPGQRYDRTNPGTITWLGLPNEDFGFQTFVDVPDVTAVPEPTTFVVWGLLGLSLTGACWWRRRS